MEKLVTSILKSVLVVLGGLGLTFSASVGIMWRSEIKRGRSIWKMEQLKVIFVL